MLYVIIGAFIGALLGFIDNGMDGVIELALPGAFYGAIAYLFIGGILGQHIQTEDIVIENIKIEALNDASEVTGADYLFAGHIDEKMVYRYVVSTDNGKQVKEIEGNNVYIKEGNYAPMIEVHQKKAKNSRAWWVAWGYEEKYTIIYVPENTVTSTYSVDLE